MKNSIFADSASFAAAVEMARYVASSSFANSLKGSINNVLMAIELSRTMEIPLPTILTNLCISDDPKRSGFFWRGPFVIALINNRGGYDKPLDWELEGTVADCSLRAKAFATRAGKRYESPWVQLSGISEELYHNNPTWANDPDKMLRFHAAAEFARLWCGELIFGMVTEGDMEAIDAQAAQPVAPVSAASAPVPPEGGPGAGGPAAEGGAGKPAAPPAADASASGKPARGKRSANSRKPAPQRDDAMPLAETAGTAAVDPVTTPPGDGLAASAPSPATPPSVVVPLQPSQATTLRAQVATPGMDLGNDVRPSLQIARSLIPPRAATAPALSF